MSATSTEIHTRKRVLFVDDEQAFLDLVAPTMEAYSGGLWDVVTASTTTKALAELQEGTIHLIVVDIHMPVVDGIQFLKLLQKKYPSVPRAVLTGDASDERRDACSANGAELFLEKPRSPDGWEIVYAMLNELAKTQQETGFQGVLRRVGIEDVLQMECLARHSLVLEIQGTAESGRVFIHQGSIIHASCKDLKGEAAFNRLLGLRGGQFNLKPFTEPDERTIVGSWEFLLMEAARMKDEGNHATQEAAGATSSLPTDITDCNPDTTQMFFRKPEAGSAAADAQATQDISSGPGGSSDGGSELDTILFEGETGGTGVGRVETLPPSPPRVQELLIVTPKGEVCHAWQCQEPQARAELISYLVQKSKQLCQGMPVGGLERVELEGLESRWVLRLDSKHIYLLHAQREQPGVSAEALPA